MNKSAELREKILEKREAHRPILRQVNDAICHQVAAVKHVIMEHPAGSESLEQPEMAGVRRLIEKGVLTVCLVDGCQLGYRDLESGLPYKKASVIITTLPTLVAKLRDKRCPGNHVHEQLQGSNVFGRRTLQAAEWPDELDHTFADAIIEQSVHDNQSEIA